MESGNKIWISCREATRLEEMRREGKIAFTSRFALWVHLLYCKFCRLFIKQSALLEKYAGDLGHNNKTFSLSNERKEAMKKMIEHG